MTSIQNGASLGRESITSTTFTDQTHDATKRATSEPGLAHEARVVTIPQEVQMVDLDRETSSRSSDISSHSSQVDQILNVQQKTIDRLLETVKTLQAEISTVTSHSADLQRTLSEQQNTVNRVLGNLEILYKGMDKINGVFTKTQESSRGDEQGQGAWNAQLLMQDTPTDTEDKFQLLTENISQFGNKAKEVDGLKLALKAMKNRVEHLENFQNSVTVQAPRETSDDSSKAIRIARQTKVQPRLTLTDTRGHNSNGGVTTSDYILTVSPHQSSVLNNSADGSKTLGQMQQETVTSDSDVRGNGDISSHAQATALEELGPGEGAFPSQSQQGWHALNTSNAASTLAKSHLTPRYFPESDMPPIDPLIVYGFEDPKDTEYHPSQDAIDSDTQEADMMEFEGPDSLLTTLANGTYKDMNMEPYGPAQQSRRNALKPTRGLHFPRGRAKRGRPRKSSLRLVTPPWEKPDWNGPEDLEPATKTATHMSPISSRGRHIVRRGLSSGVSVGSITPHQEYTLQQAYPGSDGRKRDRKRDSEGYLLRWNGERDKRSLRGALRGTLRNRGGGRGAGGGDHQDVRPGSPVQRSNSHERLMGMIFPERQKAGVDEEPLFKVEDDSSG